MIIMGPRPTTAATRKSYATAANSTASSVTNSTNQQSNDSGNSSGSNQTNNTPQSGKSAREIVLEEGLQLMATKLETALASLVTTQANSGEKQTQLEAALQENQKLHGELQKSLEEMEQKLATMQQDHREQIEAQQEKMKREMETMFMERMAENMRQVQQMMQQPTASTMTPETKRQDARRTPLLHMNSVAIPTQHYNHGAYLEHYNPPPPPITHDPYGRYDYSNYHGTFNNPSPLAGSNEPENQHPIGATRGPSHEVGPATG
jgi:myosin heavy subunit